MSDMKEPGDRRGAEPERVAVYDSPAEREDPVNTTGTTGVARTKGGREAPVGWVIPAIAVVLVVLAILWWL